MSRIIMALDQGTTSSRTILFDERGKIIASDSAPLTCYYPQSGWVEQKPEEIWDSQKQTIEGVLRKQNLKMKDITAIGITNQRETVIAWDRKTGKSVGHAIVWQCRRTANYCDQLKREGFDEVLKRKTGLVTDAYFSGTKMRWILQNNPDARQLAETGDLLFGTVDSWLVWNLTGGKKHITDVSNASRTLVFNIEKLEWDEEILNKFEIPKSSLPQVMASSEVIAHTDETQWGASVPIAGIAGDQQASLFGQACFESGTAKNTYGTGCFMLMNTGHQLTISQHGLLTTIAWKIGNKVTYALEGSVFIAGALIQWLRDGLQLFNDAKETEEMARSVDSSGGVFVVPAFVGLGAPHWDPYARGTIVGLSRNTNKNHLVRAGLEAIAFQSYDVLKSMEKDTGMKLKTLRVDGGASANNFLCQFQADILGLIVSRPEVVETTAMGAAFLAGLATGVWKNLDDIRSMWKEDQQFKPSLVASDVQHFIEGWQKAVGRSRNWMSD
ncbi:MAG: glycerol kinase GlpK [SAR324 cluster bacterium]|nr:glycerol kinase GlpK [SAR324 cluster bacterium]